VAEERSAHYSSVNCDVKMQRLVQIETHQRLYYIAKYVGGNWVVIIMGCDWVVAMRGRGVRCRTDVVKSGEVSGYTVAVVTLCSL